MDEVISATTAQAEGSTPPAPPAAAPKGKRHKKGHPVRTTIVIVLVVALLAVGGFFLFRFLNKKQEVNSTIRTQTAEWSSIQSSVQGSGSARSKESASITLQNAGIVQRVYVAEGQVVMAGDPLYEIVSPAAQEALNMAESEVEKARASLQSEQEQLTELYKQLTAAQAAYNGVLDNQRQSAVDRVVKAPFSGQLRETARLRVGDKVSSSQKLALLVDDTRFRIPFYFSYAYEGKIAVGQQASVSVNGATLAGVVDEVAMVRRVSPEGSLLFEASIVIQNPGALTEGLTASATLTGADGVAIYPYDAGTLEYYQTMEVWTKAPKSSSGEPQEVLSVNLRDYADVTEGQVLLTLSEEDFARDLENANTGIEQVQDSIAAQQERIATAQGNITAAEEKVTAAQQAVNDFAAVAPISGTITYFPLFEGQEVMTGDTAVMISNNTTMIVTISVDDRNIAYVKPGMGVELTSNWGGGGSFYGVVTKVDMSLSGDSMGSGMTNYPVTLEVDNWDGSLLEGMWLSYSFVTSQSDNCIVVPMQAVKYTTLENGDTASVVFIQADSRPENAVEVSGDGSDMYYGTAPQYPTEAEGYYAVPVSTGLADNYNVEITEGLQGGETVFVAYVIEQAWG